MSNVNLYFFFVSNLFLTFTHIHLTITHSKNTPMPPFNLLEFPLEPRTTSCAAFKQPSSDIGPHTFNYRNQHTHSFCVCSLNECHTNDTSPHITLCAPPPKTTHYIPHITEKDFLCYQLRADVMCMSVPVFTIIIINLATSCSRCSPYMHYIATVQHRTVYETNNTLDMKQLFTVYGAYPLLYWHARMNHQKWTTTCRYNDNSTSNIYV